MGDRESFLPVARRPTDGTSERICSAVTFFPLQAVQRLLHCFGYSQSLRMQSGRTYGSRVLFPSMCFTKPTEELHACY